MPSFEQPLMTFEDESDLILRFNQSAVYALSQLKKASPSLE